MNDETLNLTELIRELQAIVDSGRFEYMPTNIESVKLSTTMCHHVSLRGAATPDEIREMQRDIDDLQSENSQLERDVELLERDLKDARETCASLRETIKNQ